MPPSATFTCEQMVKRPKSVDLESVIFSKKSSGGSIRSIARDLGVSEWQVRTVLRKSATHSIQEKVYNKVRLNSVTTSSSDVKKAIVMSDIHIPHHDPAALAIAVAYTKKANPNVIVLNGDIVDMASVSRFPKDPHRIETFADELQECRDFLRLLRANHPKAQIVYLVGNHCIRLERYLFERAPDLSSLPELSICSLLKLDEFEIDYLDQSEKFTLGDLEIFHGEIVKKNSGDSARGHMLKRGGSVLIGHVHKAAMVSRTDKHGCHIAVENPHLSKPDPDYMVDPDWCQGFTEIDFSDDSGYFSVRIHVIRDGLMIADGKMYSA